LKISDLDTHFLRQNTQQTPPDPDPKALRLRQPKPTRLPNFRIKDLEKTLQRKASSNTMHRDLLLALREVRRWRSNPLRRSHLDPDLVDQIYDLYERRPYSGPKEFMHGVRKELDYPLDFGNARRFWSALQQVTDG
jgi:hypothetical protein